MIVGRRHRDRDHRGHEPSAVAGAAGGDDRRADDGFWRPGGKTSAVQSRLQRRTVAIYLATFYGTEHQPKNVRDFSCMV